jgi:transcriptional regulator with XRE-family HTH domain
MRLLMNLRLERLERALTQEEIAEEVGIPQSTWSRAERGFRIQPSSARKIAKYFDRRPKEVWDFDDAEAAAA